MRKAVWTGKESIEIVPDANGRPSIIREDDVRIRITTAGVCGTDVHIWEGRISFVPPPLVLGHEFTGVVDECGPGVRGFAPGDRVKCDSVIGCGACDTCRRGATQFCPKGTEFGITCNGGWTDYLVAPQRNLHHLPDAISDDVAAILDVEVMNALRKPGVHTGDTIAIFGAGAAGLIAVQCARILGAAKIILCDFHPERLALGERLGADHVINASETDVPGDIASVTEGRGVDLVFEAAGAEASTLAALQIVRPRGRVVFYGVPDAAVRNFPTAQVVLKDLVLYGALADRSGWDEFIELVAEGRIDLQSLITHRFPLEDAGEALATMRDRRDGAIKAVLCIGDTARTR